MALDRMLTDLPTRHYRVGLEPVKGRTEQTMSSSSRSAVSRRFVAATETALAELLAVDLSGRFRRSPSRSATLPRSPLGRTGSMLSGVS